MLHTSPTEIAEELGISRSAVDNRLWRGRRWLRERLLDLEKGGGTFGSGTTR
ncbi:sigma factor-like helix-turn-helix DNA-binding protein [Alicyclobacillus ferrooxydans]|uniref:sigma factor-like helix-turn-helix DNA-binding protein n=1 Tax=Alicyclobacillus ferrooxydans TaxID=471514 RepID=UPI0012ED3C3F